MGIIQELRPHLMSKRPSLGDEISGEWANKSDPGWIRLALFGLFGLLPVICCCILLAIFLLSSEISHDTNAPMEETRGSLSVPEVSSPIRRSTFVQSTQTQHHRPKPSTLSRLPSTTAAVPPPDDNVKDPVCTAIDCHFGAQWLRSKLDSSVDPCQDFYRYVCGTFTQYNEFADAARTILTTTVSHAYDTKVPATGQTSWQKVAGLFQTCISMSETRRSETGDLVAWMISLNLDLNNETRLRSVDAVDMIIRCSLEFGVQVIFSITFHATWFLNNRRAMQLECCPEEVKWMDSHGTTARQSHSGDYLKLLRLYGVPSPRDEQLTTRIMKYEESMHRIIKNTTPPDAPVVSGTIRGMGQTTKPYVTAGKWSTMFSKYTNNTYSGNNTIVYQQYILDILVKLIELNAVGNEGLRHLITWSMFRQLVHYTEPSYLLVNASESEVCYSNVLQVMKLAVVSPFLQSRVKPEMVREAERMMTKITAAFRAALVSSTWLDGKARAIAILKLDKMKHHVGSPGRRLDPDFVEELYASYPDVRLDRFFTSWRKALSISRHQTWADQSTWLYDEADVNAHYSVHFNAVIVPTAILQRPFFFFDFPPALNYGGIGTIMGHEIMHGYDIQGSNYDDRSQFEPWRTKKFGEEYAKRTLCIRKSHKKTLKRTPRLEMVNDTLDSENLADFVGTLSTYAAYASLPRQERNMVLPGLNVTAERLFFINTCLKWCEDEMFTAERYAPGRSRCLVPLINMPQFSAAFACAPGTPMNPLEKCTFW